MNEPKWLGPFPLERAIECKKAIYRHALLRKLGYTEEEALEDIYKWFPDLKPLSVASYDETGET